MPATKPTENTRRSTYRPLLLVATAVAVGIVADRYFGAWLGGIGLPVWWLVAAILVAVCYHLRRLELSLASTAALLLSFAALAGAWHHQSWNYVDDNHLVRFADESLHPVCVEAVALDRKQWSPAPPANPLSAVPVGSRSQLTVEVTRVRDGTQWIATSGSCRLRVEGELTGVDRGDRLRIFGQFGRPRAALNPGQFDWADAERGAGRFVSLYCRAPQCVSVLEPGESAAAGRWLDRTAYWCQHQLTKYVGRNNDDLALALLLGARERLDDTVFESFLKTGTVHLLVVSGLHVGFLAGIVWLFVRGGLLPQRFGIIATAVLVVAYAAIVGGRPPVVRATILVLFALWMLVIGRRASRSNLLAAAALVVLAYNPSELFRGGTQLSFLCVAVISWYGFISYERLYVDPLTRLIRDTQSWHRKALRVSTNWLGQLFVVSLVIWLAAAPLVAHHFHLAAPVSILLTPLIWPLVAMALVSGFAICTVAWVVPPLAYLIGWIGSLAISATRLLVDFGEGLDVGHFFCPGPAAWWLLGFYGVLAVFALVPRWHIDWKLQIATLALWIATGYGVAAIDRPDDRLNCTFLAMGHGTCVVLELPGGQTVLYDAGSLGSPEGASQTVASYLWSRGITQIDAVVLSHADIDHYNAMPGLIERFGVSAVYVSPLMFDPWATDGQLTAPNYLRETLQQAGVPLHEIWMNDRLQVADSEVEIEVLHPPRNGVVGRDNANSILLNVRYAGHSVLLPGDLESPGIEAVLAEPALDCDILLAPHHGSTGSDPPGFAAWCTPQWVVVSGRVHAHEGKATADPYQAVGGQILHTADLGAVQFQVGYGGIGVSTFRGGVVQ